MKQKRLPTYSLFYLNSATDLAVDFHTADALTVSFSAIANFTTKNVIVRVCAWKKLCKSEGLFFNGGAKLLSSFVCVCFVFIQANRSDRFPKIFTLFFGN